MFTRSGVSLLLVASFERAIALCPFPLLLSITRGDNRRLESELEQQAKVKLPMCATNLCRCAGHCSTLVNVWVIDRYFQTYAMSFPPNDKFQNSSAGLQALTPASHCDLKLCMFSDLLRIGTSLSCWLHWGEWQVAVHARPTHTYFIIE